MVRQGTVASLDFIVLADALRVQAYEVGHDRHSQHRAASLGLSS